MRTFKYKLQNHKRNKHLHRDLEIIAHVHNHFVALCRRHYRIYGQCEGYKRLTFSRMSKHLTKLKRRHRYAHWHIPFSWAVQNALKRIELGYINFFENRAKRPPKFRSRKKYRSMTFDGSQVKIEPVADAEHGIRRSPVAKIRINTRWYRFWYSRPIEGNIKQVTVKRDTLGDFYITITTDNEGLIPEPRTGETAGFDFGLKTFLTCSDGTKYESPLFYKRSATHVAKASRALSKKKRGSNNREKARLNLARAHRKIQRQREDHHWKLALELVRKFDICFFEDLNLKGMVRLWGRKISDLAFSDFMLKMRWQAHKRCKDVETIDRWTATTTVCHSCGQKHAFIDLKVREWGCSCGINHDRDINAAINIKKVGTSTFLNRSAQPLLATSKGYDSRPDSIAGEGVRLAVARLNQTRDSGHPSVIAESPSL
jgi:putative transposase